MSVDLYYYAISSPCRAVLLTAEAIGLPLNLIEVNLFTGENMTPEFQQLNPQRTVPLLLDGDYKLTESRAIMSYLVDQYGKNSRLYPQNPAARAIVNQRLYFDIGTLFKTIKDCYFPVVFDNEKEIDPERYKKVETAFEIMDNFLEGQDYIAGRNLTIADLSLTATTSTAEVFGFEVQKYPNVTKWFEKTKSSAPGYRKANGDGLQMLKEFMEKSKEE